MLVIKWKGKENNIIIIKKDYYGDIRLTEISKISELFKIETNI